MRSHTISVEPLAKIYTEWGWGGVPLDPADGHLLVMERGDKGSLLKVVHQTADYDEASTTAKAAAETYGATFVTASAWFPTVVGRDVAETVRLDVEHGHLHYLRPDGTHLCMTEA